MGTCSLSVSDNGNDDDDDSDNEDGCCLFTCTWAYWCCHAPFPRFLLVPSQAAWATWVHPSNPDSEEGSFLPHIIWMCGVSITMTQNCSHSGSFSEFVRPSSSVTWISTLCRESKLLPSDWISWILVPAWISAALQIKDLDSSPFLQPSLLFWLVFQSMGFHPTWACLLPFSLKELSWGSRLHGWALPLMTHWLQSRNSLSFPWNVISCHLCKSISCISAKPSLTWHFPMKPLHILIFPWVDVSRNILIWI